MPQKSFRAAWIRFQNPCEFWSGLGRGSAGGFLEKRRSNDAGSAALASAMACGGNPRVLPDLRAGAAWQPGVLIGG